MRSSAGDCTIYDLIDRILEPYDTPLSIFVFLSLTHGPAYLILNTDKATAYQVADHMAA